MSSFHPGRTFIACTTGDMTSIIANLNGCKNRGFRIALIGLLMILIGSAAGCFRPAVKKGDESIPGLHPWNADSYAAYVVQNIEALNRRYTGRYEPVEFVVDTAGGSARVQTLIDPSATDLLAEVVAGPAAGDGKKIEAIVEVLRQRFVYIPEPQAWAPVSETIRAGNGDCKNLSVVLMSALTSAGIPAYGAISNGHMWVCAFDGSKWRIIEIDDDPQRKRIYRIPGFYQDPLYKILPEHSLKRIPR